MSPSSRAGAGAGPKLALGQHKTIGPPAGTSTELSESPVDHSIRLDCQPINHFLLRRWSVAPLATIVIARPPDQALTGRPPWRSHSKTSSVDSANAHRSHRTQASTQVSRHPDSPPRQPCCVDRVPFAVADAGSAWSQSLTCSSATWLGACRSRSTRSTPTSQPSPSSSTCSAPARTRAISAQSCQSANVPNGERVRARPASPR